MAKWTDYTIDTNPTDTDEVMTLDADKSPKANKRVTLSTLADYFLDKLASKVFAKLETKNQTVIGALNELNSKQQIFTKDISVDFAVGDRYKTVSNVVENTEKIVSILPVYTDDAYYLNIEDKIQISYYFKNTTMQFCSNAMIKSRTLKYRIFYTK